MPFLSLVVKSKDWEQEIWTVGLNQPSALGTEEQQFSCLRPPSTWTALLVLLDGCNLPPTTCNPPASLQPLTALPCSSTWLCCGAGSIGGCSGCKGSPLGPGCLWGCGWAGGCSSWRAIPDNWQVDEAAGGQVQTGGRWRGQREGNTTLYSTWH